MTAQRYVLRISLILFLPALLGAKSYYHPLVHTDITLAADGSAHVVQTRTYSFSGSYSWAFVELKKHKVDDITFTRLSESTDAGWRDLEPTEMENTDRSLYVRWSYSAVDEERTFQLEYTVLGAVRRYQDAAEFYWKAIEDEHARIGENEIEVRLPGASPGLFKVYVHSAARPGKLAITADQGRAAVAQGGIPANTFVEVRVLTDPNLFPQVTMQPERRYERILAEEKQNFIASSVRKYVFIPLGLLLLIPLPLVLLLVFYYRYGREPKLDYQALYEHEPPRAAPPLAVPPILHQKPDKSSMSQELFQGMMATLLDLGRRGAVKVIETKEGRKTRYAFRLERPEIAAKGSEFDRTVVEFFFGRVAGGGNELDDSMLKEYGRNHSSEVQALLGSVLEAGKDWWQSQLGADFTDAQSRKAYGIFTLLAVLCAAPGAFLFMTGLRQIAPESGKATLPLTIVVAALASIVFAGFGRVILRWDPAAYLEHKRWKSFRKFLRDFSAIEQAPVSLLGIWEQYYVYAVVLGVAEEFLKNVGRLAEARGTSLALPVWYVAAAGAHGPSVASFTESMAGFQSFAGNVNGMMQSFSTASSSGGGFSGGGGGGGRRRQFRRGLRLAARILDTFPISS